VVEPWKEEERGKEMEGSGESKTFDGV